MGKFACLEVCPLTKSWTTEERAALAHFLQSLELNVKDNINELNGLLLLDGAELEMTFADHGRKIARGQIVGIFKLLKNPSQNFSLEVTQPGQAWLLKTEDWFELKAVSPSIALQILEDTLLYLRAESQAHPAMIAGSLFH